MTEPIDSTLSLITRAYPDGIPEGEYTAVLQLLYPHASDRSLAAALSLATGRDPALVYNDLLGVVAQNLDQQVMLTVQNRLMKAGLLAWRDED